MSSSMWWSGRNLREVGEKELMLTSRVNAPVPSRRNIRLLPFGQRARVKTENQTLGANYEPYALTCSES